MATESKLNIGDAGCINQDSWRFGRAYKDPILVAKIWASDPCPCIFPSISSIVFQKERIPVYVHASRHEVEGYLQSGIRTDVVACSGGDRCVGVEADLQGVAGCSTTIVELCILLGIASSIAKDTPKVAALKVFVEDRC